ncbi:MAG: ribosomal protein S18-alanine N-acetyltransferase [Butyricicoccus sp.]
METIIFVCTGNTCRSPMAEGLFRAHNGEEKTGLTAASAGLYTETAFRLRERGCRSRRTWRGYFGAPLAAADRRDGENAKYLVCMTGSHYDRLCELFPTARTRFSRCCPRTFPTVRWRSRHLPPVCRRDRQGRAGGHQEPEPMNIVVMQERHLAALAEIERACFHAPWSENMLREELGKGIFLVAEQDGRTAGYVGCQTVLDEGYITNVAVSPDFRRQGIARALIAELTAKAGENKLAFVTLEVRESNAPAIALYTGAGFAPVGKRKNFYSNPTENAVLMTISLI